MAESRRRETERESRAGWGRGRTGEAVADEKDRDRVNRPPDPHE